MDTFNHYLKYLSFSALLLISQAALAQDLVDYEFKGSQSLEQMQAEYGFLMQNGIEYYKIRYTTPDINGVPDTASGLLVLPVREAEFQYPLLCYMHGTVDSKQDVPSNLSGGWELAAVWGGLGFVTAAPDFLGLGESRGFHPYVHADTEASAGIDMLFAAKAFCEAEGPAINEQLFITGYSQGGHGAAAVHRELEANYADDFTVTASAPMSGPYSISGVTRAALLSEEPYFYQGYLAYTALSYNEAYGLFDSVEAYFKNPYAAPIQEFYDGAITLGTLNNTLIDLLTANEGAPISRYMLQDSLLTAVESGDPNHPIIQALADNDVYDWTPQSPTRLYYCTADDQVAFTNSILADSVMNANGAADVMAIDAGATLNHTACVQPATIAGALFFLGYRDLISDVADAGLANNIRAFPNPVDHTLHLQGLPPQAVLQLFHSNGQVVHQQAIRGSQVAIDMSAHPSGLYLLRVESTEGPFTLKVLHNGMQ
ncbi:MAG: T9SS type A sorting domain-containing protein [Phaeodactylibacter sp.]|uniref:T9SS type A sorting domain-containing protein n=1 Tax=Phaeodactylibacter sp. TaxID=1940289 RepID=UPI0032EBB8C4